MKDKVLSILLDFNHTVSDGIKIYGEYISKEDYNEIVEDIVKLFAIPDVSISLPHLEATLAEKTLLLVSKENQNNREARRLKSDIELLTNSIKAIKRY